MIKLARCCVIALLALASLGHAQTSRLPEHLRAGAALLQQQKFSEAVTAFDAIVRENPEDGEAWFQLGLAHHFAGDLDQAIRADLLAIHLVGPKHPYAVPASYNVACVYALQEKTERALRWLHRARNAGFSDFKALSADTDLTALAGEPRFEAFKKIGSISKPAEDSAAVTTVTEVISGGTGGVALGADGVLFVANFGADVWVVQPDGGWKVHATGFTKAADCTLDRDGRLLQVDHADSKVWSIAPDGTRTDLMVKGLNFPVGIDTGEDRTFYVTNFRDNSILHVEPDGSSTVVASRGLLNGPNGIAYADEHRVFIANYNDGGVLQLDPTTGDVRFLCELPGGGNGHIAWSGEILYVTARQGHAVYRVALDGGVSLVAGSGLKGTRDGGASTSQLSLPNGIALTADGKTIFVNDQLPGRRCLVRRIELDPE